jgi:hypothetical protein
MSLKSRLTSYSPDIIYLDLTILNNDTQGNKAPVFLSFTEQRDIAILDDPQEWHLSVIRFFVDTPNLPLMIFPVVTGQTDINKSIYTITLKYGENEVQQNLNFVPVNTSTRLPKPPLINQDNSTGYYEIYNYSYFINILNNALSSAFSTLSGLASLPSTVPPYLEWDPNNLKAILNADILGYDLSLTTPIEIYFNSPLFYLFSSFDAFYLGNEVVSGENFKINIRNIQNGNIYTSNGINYLQVYQEFPTLGPLSNPLDSIIFTTNQIPVVPSIQSKPQIFNQTLNQTQDFTNKLSLNILTDIQIGLDFGYETKPGILYNPQAEYRLISLQSTQPLRSYDVSVYWKDASSNLYPFFLASGSSASIKIMFRKKNYLYGDKEL